MSPILTFGSSKCVNIIAMSGPESPKNKTPIESVAPVEKERVAVSIPEIKDVVVAKLEGVSQIKAIKKLEIRPQNKKLFLDIKIDAGNWGEITVGGQVVNSGREIAVSDLEIGAGWIVKTAIKSKVSSLVPGIKKYLEEKYKKVIVGMSVSDSGLTVEFLDTRKMTPDGGASAPKAVAETPVIPVEKSSAPEKKTGPEEIKRLMDKAAEAYDRATEERRRREEGN